MASTRSFVTMIERIDGFDPAKKGSAALTADAAIVHFANGQTGQLARADERAPLRAEILDDLRRQGHPAYVEIEEGTGAVRAVLIPLIGRVLAVNDIGGGLLAVELEPFQGVPRLPPTHDRYSEIRATLSQAVEHDTPVAVTVSDEGILIDAERWAGPFRMILQPESPESVISPETLRTADITLEHAKEMFRLVASASCKIGNVVPPCIPFLFPDNGCWARAHEMARIMSARHTIGKLWIYGVGTVKTRNSPVCSVWWRYHVAPTLYVTERGGKLMVIDPSLMPGPATEQEWKERQNKNARTVLTHGGVFYRSKEGKESFDNSFEETRKLLERFRTDLKGRAPPYAHCPADTLIS